jgi:hypothetical protein
MILSFAIVVSKSEELAIDALQCCVVRLLLIRFFGVSRFSIDSCSDVLAHIPVVKELYIL